MEHVKYGQLGISCKEQHFSSLSNSVWVSRSNSSCGIRIGRPPDNNPDVPGDHEGSPTSSISMTGHWSVIADYFDGISHRKLTSTLKIDPRPAAPPAAPVVSVEPVKNTTIAVENKTSIFGKSDHVLCTYYF